MNGLRHAVCTCAIVASVCTAVAPHAQAVEALKVLPYCNFAFETAGSTLAEVAWNAPHPVVKTAGAVFKLTELALDVSEAAVEGHDRWLDSELVLISEDGHKLKEIKTAGGDLNGAQATEIKHRLLQHQFAMSDQPDSTFTYTLNAVEMHMGYALIKVGTDKAIEKSFGYAFDKLGVSRLIARYVPVPKKVKWLFDYGGPLEQAQKNAGWWKLGTRARLAKKAAENAMQDQEEKLVAYSLRLGRMQGLKAAADHALGIIYLTTLEQHPSEPRAIVVSDFRLQIARQAAPVQASAAAIPATAATPRPVLVTAAQAEDRVVRTINAEDTSHWQHYDNFVQQEQRTVDTVTAPPETYTDPEPPAWQQRLHEEMKLVGDGKTFQVCSNGCPSTTDSSWDGGRGQTLDDR